jgi:hypothetical protein
MILPHPESDLSINIMVLGIDIIRFLKKRDYVLIEDVLENFIKSGIKRTPEMFFNTLTFLFSFGMIEKRDYKIKLNSKQEKQLGLF